MIGFLLILFHQGSEESEESRTIIKEYGNVQEEGQERSNDSTEERTEDLPHYDRRRRSDSTAERTENLPHNERRRSSAIAESRIAQIVRDTFRDTLREERGEMGAQLKYAPCLHCLASDHTVTSTFRTFDDLKIAVDRLLFVLQSLKTLREQSLDN